MEGPEISAIAYSVAMYPVIIDTMYYFLVYASQCIFAYTFPMCLLDIILVNSGVIAGVVIAVLVGLVIIGGITALIIYFIVRSRSASYLARRYMCNMCISKIVQFLSRLVRKFEIWERNRDKIRTQTCNDIHQHTLLVH